jgi:C1A family cysteine protease
MKPWLYVKDWWKARHSGLIPSAKDDRDYRFSGATDESLPEAVDLREHYKPVIKNQGSLEACTGYAASSLVECLSNAGFKTKRRVSPLWIWYHGKRLHGWELENKGVWLRYTLKALLESGYVYEDLYPESNGLTPPRDLSIMKKFTVQALKDFFVYTSVSNSQLKTALSKGEAVVVALDINNSFFGNTTGVIKNSPKNGYSHALLLVGYDDGRQVFIAQNSWGVFWGDSGYCYIPYDYALANITEAWTLDFKEEYRTEAVKNG